MDTETKSDGKHYITAKVIIPADEFAEEMIGENPTPQKLESFIRDNASLMEFVYGSVRITDTKGLTQPDISAHLNDLHNNVSSIMYDYEFLLRKVTEIEAKLTLKAEPWWKMILGL